LQPDETSAQLVGTDSGDAQETAISDHVLWVLDTTVVLVDPFRNPVATGWDEVIPFLESRTTIDCRLDIGVLRATGVPRTTAALARERLESAGYRTQLLVGFLCRRSSS